MTSQPAEALSKASVSTTGIQTKIQERRNRSRTQGARIWRLIGPGARDFQPSRACHRTAGPKSSATVSKPLLTADGFNTLVKVTPGDPVVWQQKVFLGAIFG